LPGLGGFFLLLSTEAKLRQSLLTLAKQSNKAKPQGIAFLEEKKRKNAMSDFKKTHLCQLVYHELFIVGGKNFQLNGQIFIILFFVDEWFF
jgi:hypothetical protein